MAPGRRIPFYGTERPDLFAIERRVMDPAGLVIDALAARLPAGGRIADVGEARTLLGFSFGVDLHEHLHTLALPGHHIPYGNAERLRQATDALSGPNVPIVGVEALFPEDSVAEMSEDERFDRVISISGSWRWPGDADAVGKRPSAWPERLSLPPSPPPACSDA